MSRFPEIQRPCPYLDRLETVIDGGFCRMCRRDVHDLTAMDARERTDFLAARGGDACISYAAAVKPAVAAALIAASAAVLAAPGAALAANHHADRSHHRQRPVEAPPVMIRLAGVPAPFAVPPHDPIRPLPPADPGAMPKKPQ